MVRRLLAVDNGNAVLCEVTATGCCSTGFRYFKVDWLDDLRILEIVVQWKKYELYSDVAYAKIKQIIEPPAPGTPEPCGYCGSTAGYSDQGDGWQRCNSCHGC